jgi:hypothetical protein
MIPAGVRAHRYGPEAGRAAALEASTKAAPARTAAAKMTHLIAGATAPPRRCYDVDIIILALERREETLAAVASAIGQTGVSAHIFILDQGSCPETLEHLARTVRNRDDATLLAAERNLGVAGGRDLISDLGHGRVIVALDNDAEFASPDTVARMVAALDAEPRLAAIGCRIVTYADGNDDLSSWGYPADLLPCAGGNFDTVTYDVAAVADMPAQGDGAQAEIEFLPTEKQFRVIPAGLLPGLAEDRVAGTDNPQPDRCPKQRCFTSKAMTTGLSIT